MVKTALRRYWPVLIATAILLPHARAFDFVTDDAYISFRYARNLADHGRLVFNLGERVEGFTNFLWTVLLAACMKLGVGPVAASRFFGVVFAVGTLAVVVRMALRLDGERSRPVHVAAPLALAATGAFACWVTGGLETQMFTFLTVLAVDRFLDESERGAGAGSAVWFALAAMTRPEGAFFFAIAGLYRVASLVPRPRALFGRENLRWVGLYLAIFVPYFVWRWRYYGHLFPNTFYVKSSGGAGTVRQGLFYLRRLTEDYELALVLPLLLAGFPPAADRRRRAFFRFTILFCVVFAAYVVKVGGDFMGLYRFVLPAFPLLALAVVESLRTLGARLRPLIGRPAAVAAGLAAAAGYAAGSASVSRWAVEWSGAEGGIDTPAYLKSYVDDRVPVGRWFGRHARPDDFMSVGGAGVIPYYSGIAAFDAFGLVDEHIAHDPKMSVGDRPGHQKWPTDSYVVSRHPTLITHIYHLRERYLPQPEEAAYWAARGYEWVTADIPEIRPPYYSFLKRMDRAFGPFPARVPTVR